MYFMKLSSISQVAQEITKNSVSNCRFVVAICGAPGSGKSTFSDLLQSFLTDNSSQNAAGVSAQIIAMDGFHYDNETLAEQGLLSVKGAPQTFDVAAFENLLNSLKNQQQDLCVPVFERDLEQVIPNAVRIAKETQIIIVEGNYLLLDQQPWNQLKQHFDLTVFIEVAQSELQQRLTKRWLDQGFDLVNAERKAIDNDLVNARLVIQHSYAADIYFSSSADSNPKT